MKIKDINVCSRLAGERKRLKLTQNQIASTCHVSVKTVGRWEKNVAIPADKLALLIPLKYDITYLLTNVRFEVPNDTLSKNAHAEQSHNLQEKSTKLSQEQHMWLNILENLTNNDASQIKEIGLALLGYSQAKNTS